VTNTRVIINKIVVRDFYTQNAGFFLFLFLVFFGIVAPSQQLAYHYSLILGMLAAPGFMLLVGLAWLFYALKVERFVIRTLDSPENRFLYLLNRLPSTRIYLVLLKMQCLLFLPVSGYSLAVSIIAWYKGAWLTAVFVQLYVGTICLLATAWYQHRLIHPGNTPGQQGRLRRGRQAERRYIPYCSILLRYLFHEHPALLGGLKIFGCGILYALLNQRQSGDDDLRIVYLTYSMAIFGHGMLLYRCRELEATRLLCYRALPVSTTARFGQYALFCFLLLLPEMLITGWLMPLHIQSTEALELLMSGYSILLLLNSFLLIMPLRTGDFLTLCLVIFGILYGCVLGAFLFAMTGFFVFMAALLFYKGYSRYEFR
jgi:hypothetical protein